jgi:hypothetical protein
MSQRIGDIKTLNLQEDQQVKLVDGQGRIRSRQTLINKEPKDNNKIEEVMMKVRVVTKVINLDKLNYYFIL